VISTACTGSCKSDYHTITTTTSTVVNEYSNTWRKRAIIKYCCDFKSCSWWGVLDKRLCDKVTCHRSVVFSGHSGYIYIGMFWRDLPLVYLQDYIGMSWRDLPLAYLQDYIGMFWRDPPLAYLQDYIGMFWRDLPLVYKVYKREISSKHSYIYITGVSRENHWSVASHFIT
jgi:hypothetical protein